jgi:hypothetical protein
MARPSYLRPYGAQNIQLQEPAPIADRLQAAGGPGPRRIPGVLGQDPREVMRSEFTRGLGDLASAQMRESAGPPQRPGVGRRVLDVLEAAGQQDLPQSDPYDPSFAGSAATGFLRSFATVRGTQRQMSLQQEREQRLASESSARTDLQHAQAEYYRARAGAPEHVSSGGIPLSERIQLSDVQHGHRMEEIGSQQAGLLERLRYARAHPLRRATDAGLKIPPADKVVLQRYQSALTAGQRGVEAERGRRSRAYDPGMTPQEERNLLDVTRHAVNPSFSEDSAAVINRINPELYGGQNPIPPNFGGGRGHTMGGRHGLLDRLRGAATPPAPGPALPPDETSTATPDADTLDEQEITDALANIQGLEDDEARSELETAGYTPDQVDRLMALRR